MDKNEQNDLALMRYGIIAPVICHTLPPEMSNKEFFEEAAKQTYKDPKGRDRKFSASTLERWYYSYHHFGFNALTGKTRKDYGSFRKVDSDIENQIIYFRKKFPRITNTEIYNKLVDNGTITNGSLSLSTLNRCVNKLKAEENVVKDEYRRYEREHINSVWCGDTCVGPKIMIEGKKQRIYFLALIDDASRFIVGMKASYNDNYEAFLQLLKSAVLKYGVPSMYNLDNGGTYKNRQMDLFVARTGSQIYRDRPRTPSQKAKIERFILTFRRGFLSCTDLNEFTTIEEIQKSVDSFILKYNQRVHTSLNGLTPEERFFSESDRIRYLQGEDLDKYFLLEIERKASIDGVVSINKIEYEVDQKFAKQRVTLRYYPDMSKVFVLDTDDKGNEILTPIKKLNKIDNSKIKRNKVYYSGGEADGD